MDVINRRLEEELTGLQAEASALTAQQARVRQEREAMVTRLRHTLSHKRVVEAAQVAVAASLPASTEYLTRECW